jgi:hypothetical protein
MWGKSFSGETRIFAGICVVTHDWGFAVKAENPRTDRVRGRDFCVTQIHAGRLPPYVVFDVPKG